MENVLWHDGRITGLVDLEWARRSWLEVDLEIVTALCAFPAWSVSEALEVDAHAEDWAGVPGWLAEDHPGWVAHPRRDDRLAVLAITRHLGGLVDFPPRGPRDPADPKDRRNALIALAESRRST